MRSPLSPRECGRRLYVAVLSCCRNDIVMAETDELHGPESVDPFWEDLAVTLVTALNRRLGKPPRAGTKGVLVPWPQATENTEADF